MQNVTDQYNPISQNTLEQGQNSRSEATFLAKRGLGDPGSPANAAQNP